MIGGRRAGQVPDHQVFPAQHLRGSGEYLRLVVPEPDQPQQRPVRRERQPGERVHIAGVDLALPGGGKLCRARIHRHDARIESPAGRVNGHGLVPRHRECERPDWIAILPSASASLPIMSLTSRHTASALSSTHPGRGKDKRCSTLAAAISWPSDPSSRPLQALVPTSRPSSDTLSLQNHLTTVTGRGARRWSSARSARTDRCWRQSLASAISLTFGPYRRRIFR